MQELLTLPDERLRQKADIVTDFNEDLASLLLQLEASMLAGPGGVGVAASQLGVLKRVIVVDCTLGLRPCKNHGRLFMVNPEIITKDGEVLGREGCLSVPEWVGTVPRARSITVRYQDAEGQVFEIESKAFEARVIQHEIDHLNGILFVDRIVSTKDLIRRMNG